jgi:hypothetical protein
MGGGGFGGGGRIGGGGSFGGGGRIGGGGSGRIGGGGSSRIGGGGGYRPSGYHRGPGRHYGYRPYYYHPPGWWHYRWGWGYWGYRPMWWGLPGNFFCTCLCCILTLGLIIGIAGSVYVNYGGQTSNIITVEPASTRLLSIPDGAQTMDVSASGALNTYFFYSKPALSVNDPWSDSSSFTLYSEYYEYRYAYMNEGSVVDISWTSSYSIEFYVVQGTSEFNDLENGYDFDYEDMVTGSSDTWTYIVTTADIYYFVWYNPGYSTASISYTLDIVFKEYDVSGAVATESGTFSKDITGLNYKYAVFQNPSNSYGVDVSYEIQRPVANYMPVFWVMFAVIIVLLFVVVGKKKAPPQSADQQGTQGQIAGQPQSGTPQYQQYQQPTQTQYPQNTAYGTQIYATQPATAAPNQAGVSGPKFCKSCGSQLDADLTQKLQTRGKVFCTFCGNEITL